MGLLYPKGVDCDLLRYLNPDFIGCRLERKSTSDTCHLLGNSLVWWHSKKQASVMLSTLEATYVFEVSCCAQTIWMKQQPIGYGVKLGLAPIRCNNVSAINLTKNTKLHSWAKHIYVRPHFIRYRFKKGECILDFVDSYNQLVDIFTKPFPKENLLFYKKWNRNFKLFMHELIYANICVPMFTYLSLFSFLILTNGEKYTLRGSRVYSHTLREVTCTLQLIKGEFDHSIKKSCIRFILPSPLRDVLSS